MSVVFSDSDQTNTSRPGMQPNVSDEENLLPNINSGSDLQLIGKKPINAPISEYRRRDFVIQPVTIDCLIL